MINPINYNEVVLVNSKDEIIGTMEKLAAHQSGDLHRAFSVFIFNEQGEMLIQKRASTKYHSATKWSNACCSHPTLNEKVENAAKRRLMEELSIDAEPVFVFSFEYRTEFENGLIENELDHVLVAFSNDQGEINENEVTELKFISVVQLVDEMKKQPDAYSVWFKLIVFDHWHKIVTYLENRNLQIA